MPEYSKENIIFISAISVAMVTIIGLGTLLSILSARRRNRKMTQPPENENGYSFTSYLQSAWTTEGRYNPIVV